MQGCQKTQITCTAVQVPHAVHCLGLAELSGLYLGAVQVGPFSRHPHHACAVHARGTNTHGHYPYTCRVPHAQVWRWPGQGVYAIFGRKPERTSSDRFCTGKVVYHQWLAQLRSETSASGGWYLDQPLGLHAVEGQGGFSYGANRTYVMEKNWMPFVHKQQVGFAAGTGCVWGGAHVRRGRGRTARGTGRLGKGWEGGRAGQGSQGAVVSCGAVLGHAARFSWGAKASFGGGAPWPVVPDTTDVARAPAYSVILAAVSLAVGSPANRQKNTSVWHGRPSTCLGDAPSYYCCHAAAAAPASRMARSACT